jgi:hypothetical protein
MSFDRGSPVNSFPPAIVGTKILTGFSSAAVLGEGDVPLCARQRSCAAFLALYSGVSRTNAGGQSTRIELKRRRFITKQSVILTGQPTESNHTGVPGSRVVTPRDQ